jgi:hypothetical protein
VRLTKKYIEGRVRRLGVLTGERIELERQTGPLRWQMLFMEIRSPRPSDKAKRYKVRVSMPRHGSWTTNDFESYLEGMIDTLEELPREYPGKERIFDFIHGEPVAAKQLKRTQSRLRQTARELSTAQQQIRELRGDLIKRG